MDPINPQPNSAPTPAPVSQTPAPVATTPAPTPVTQAAAAPTPKTCKCPTVNAADWDKKKQIINKVFFKAFSPRIFYYPFSFVIDVLRAQKAAIAKGYKPVENGMVLDDGAMFLGNAMIEVTGANTNDPAVLSLEGKEVYTKVSRRPWNQIKLDIDELTKELGKKPAQFFIWYTSCPGCTENKEVKSVLIALP